MIMLPQTQSKAQRATWLLCLLVWCQPLLIGYFITVVHSLTGIPYDVFYHFLLPALYIILTFISAPYISKKLKNTDWLFYFVFLAVVFTSYIIESDNREYLGSILTVIPFVMLPLYFLGVSFELEPLKKHFYYISITSIIVQIIFFRLIVANQIASYAEQDGADHYMYLSYQILPYVLYAIWWAFENFKILNVFFAVIGGVLLLLLGTRGAFVSVVFYVVVYFVVFKYSHLRVVQKMLIIAGGILLYCFYSSIMTHLEDVIDLTGGSGRIIAWIMGEDKGSATSSKARVDMAYLTMNELKKSNYIGLGFAGDRIIMGGWWVHNFVLECLISFGIVFGVLIPMIIFYRLIKGVLRDTDSNKCKFLLLLVGLGLIPILFSGSYVETTWFYLMLGYCTQTLRSPKRKSV